MRAQTRLCTASTHAAQGAQTAREAQQRNSRGLGKRRGKAVEHHGGVIEDVGCKAVGLAFWLERGAEAVREEDRGDAAERLLDDGEEQRLCWGGSGVADADAFEDRAGGEEAGYRGGEG